MKTSELIEEVDKKIQQVDCDITQYLVMFIFLIAIVIIFSIC